jgi:hypothetical protein
MVSTYMLMCAHVREKYTPTRSPTSQQWHPPSTCLSGGAPPACYNSPYSILIDPLTHFLVILDCSLLFVVVVVNAYVLFPPPPFTRTQIYLTSHDEGRPEGRESGGETVL